MLLQNDQLFNTIFNRLSDISTEQVPMDAYRRGSDVWVHLDMPGVATDSIDVEVERNVLTVKAERVKTRQDSDQIYINDRRSHTFRRQVHLGDSLDSEGIVADYHDGVLTLQIPVAEKAKPRKIRVDASGPAADSTDVETPAIETQT